MQAGSEQASAQAAELDALRSGAGFTPLDERALLAVRGEDRASFLQGMLSNDIAGCAPGQGVHALLLTEQGRIVAELRAYALEGEIWLDVPEGALEPASAALEQYIVADDVELARRSAYGIALRGAKASRVLASAMGRSDGDFDQLAECGHRTISLAGGAGHVARVRDVGLDGFHLWLDASGLRDACLDRLAQAGAVSCSSKVVETQRIAAGWAKQDVDFDAHTLAAEVPSLARAISHAKGCYLGQEVVERVAARGHVNWLVVALRAQGASPAFLPGAAVLHDEREVGRVSSVAVLPGVGGQTIALARIRRTAADPGTLVVVGGEGGRQARVVPIPIEG